MLLYPYHPETYSSIFLMMILLYSHFLEQYMIQKIGLPHQQRLKRLQGNIQLLEDLSNLNAISLSTIRKFETNAPLGLYVYFSAFCPVNMTSA